MSVRQYVGPSTKFSNLNEICCVAEVDELYTTWYAV